MFHFGILGGVTGFAVLTDFKTHKTKESGKKEFGYTIWLVVSTYSSEKYESVAMKLPTEWKVIIHSMVPVTTKQPFIFHYQRVNHH